MMDGVPQMRIQKDGPRLVGGGRTCTASLTSCVAIRYIQPLLHSSRQQSLLSTLPAVVAYDRVFFFFQGMDSSNLESVREVYMIGPQMHYNNRGNGGGSSSSSSHGSGGSVGSRPSSCPSQGPVVRIPVASGVVGGSPGEAWRGERGAPPHMPLVLVTVDSKSRRVSARAVVNCGNGHVVSMIYLKTTNAKLRKGPQRNAVFRCT